MEMLKALCYQYRYICPRLYILLVNAYNRNANTDQLHFYP